MLAQANLSQPTLKVLRPVLLHLLKQWNTPSKEITPLELSTTLSHNQWIAIFQVFFVLYSINKYIFSFHIFQG